MNLKEKRKRRGYHIVIALFFFLTPYFDLRSQDTLNTLLVEQKTYQLYTAKNWNELTSFGNTAIKKGFDYFYIEMRVGIAYYEKQNYCLAAPHFKKALEFSSGDELALEYLYYCYVFTGRNEDARELSKQFKTGLASKTETDQLPDLGFFMAEAGTKIASANSFNQDVSGPYSKGNTTTYVPLKNTFSIDPAKYVQLGLTHYAKKSISLFHAVTFFNQTTTVDSTINSQQKLTWYIPPPKNADTTITSVSTLNSTHNYSLTQLQYYLKAGIPLKNDWMISPSLGIVHTSFSDNPTMTHTPANPRPPMPPVLVTPKPNDPPFAYPAYTLTSNFIVGSFALQKTYRKFVFGLGSTFSNLQQEEVDRTKNKIVTSTPAQLINSATVYFSPLGNSKLVLGCMGYIHTITSYQTTYASASAFIYAQPAKFFSIKLAYFNNTGKNIVEDNGYFVNNSPDLTLNRWSVLANFHVSKTVTLYATYLLESKVGLATEAHYNYNILAAGIKISPLHKKN